MRSQQSNIQSTQPASSGSVCARGLLELLAVRRSGFTLIEIMIVVGIMGIILGMGVPLVYKIGRRAPMNQAIADIIEVCSTARAQAILQGKEFNVEFHPRAGTLQVVAGKSIGPARVNTGPSMPSPAPAVPSSSPSSSPSGFSAKLSDRILIELLDINKLPHDFREDESAWVRFFPDGTCDELTLILLSDRNERREITLEVTTGLANVESDPRRFR